tara:strand:+ start:240 stop:539 length:300 start_codon:yes stop_codon:yes gene_type:complete
MNFTGKIKTILPVVHGDYNGTANAKRVVVLESDPNEKGYTETYAVELYKTGDFIKHIDTDFDLAEGDQVKTFIGGKANEYNGKYYNSLRVFKIEKVDSF